jgi:hypothetical protein
MLYHQLVRVHDAAGKDAINERLIRIEPFITFRGIYDALEPDRPLLKVKVCTLADTPIARATSIPKSDFDEVIDTSNCANSSTDRCAAHAESSTWHRSALSTLAVSSPCRRLLGSVGLCRALCSICSDQGLVPSQKTFRGTQAAAKRKVVGVKRNRNATSSRPPGTLPPWTSPRPLPRRFSCTCHCATTGVAYASLECTASKAKSRASPPPRSHNEP